MTEFGSGQQAPICPSGPLLLLLAEASLAAATPAKRDMIDMGKKEKLRAKHRAEKPLESALIAEAAYYARRCGITIHEAAKIIRQATHRTR
ncbi:hypothetical protein EOA27_14470 [Mesorhizobium sp. M2A.F.Ca.ET.037.01.1.1]|nr:hypothetical protein EJ068_20465 [Mesorhizobium sp. M2A.F.Ca.ET.043.02.1.1]AZO34710.1 hypothetical protein EJ072_09775 [Mesorhizobium sp. M2A.F.Ca.ET.046.03.2.1]RUW42179.1 hypothetical protein EOA37_06385 [Mesorhizobium sp. M2A.F.Ca.ET.015.02.1.1]RUW81344.1 hypothetical protein EOA28_01615 [Mesorhizobium sp. M2A.F.Ca.ET.067.02.1.1]RUX17609.1 hypothetical protein EOA27_14470 [Mesorhizobium sp. M2A.F.Ca.ET.037.01.1.1]RUY13331.1 hypothetical protein EOA25_00665 [Mesorhizobium sp. M2A.F.Ca.ET.0